MNMKPSFAFCRALSVVLPLMSCAPLWAAHHLQEVHALGRDRCWASAVTVEGGVEAIKFAHFPSRVAGIFLPQSFEAEIGNALRSYGITSTPPAGERVEVRMLCLRNEPLISMNFYTGARKFIATFRPQGEQFKALRVRSNYLGDTDNNSGGFAVAEVVLSLKARLSSDLTARIYATGIVETHGYHAPGKLMKLKLKQTYAFREGEALRILQGVPEIAQAVERMRVPKFAYAIEQDSVKLLDIQWAPNR